MIRRDRPADEIDVSPEMIEAGSQVIQDYFLAQILDAVADPGEVAEYVFRAMISRRTERGNNSKG